MILPPQALPLLRALSPAFTRPTFARFVFLMAAAILTSGRRTIANLLRIAAPLAAGHRTSYQRVFSCASWSALQLACCTCRFVISAFIPADRPITLVGDDTVEGRPGDKVYAKARHRDPVRSTRTYTAWRYGHKWVVLAILVRLPGTTRPWALPVLVDLYRSKEDDAARGRPHRTPARIMAALLRVMLLWFPDHRFVFVGDAGYGTHELARFARRHRPRLVLVSKLHPEANLFDPPPPYKGNGRPPIKGARLPKPSRAAAAAELRDATVAWYGGGTRSVGIAHGTGHWYKSGEGLVEIAWVFVRDRTGTHRDEYFFSTDAGMGPAAMVEAYTGRWNIEGAFESAKLESGLADFEVRSWTGWHRHVTLSLLAHAVLAVVRELAGAAPQKVLGPGTDRAIVAGGAAVAGAAAVELDAGGRHGPGMVGMAACTSGPCEAMSL